MRSFLTLSLLPLAVSATNILLPLYVYPSAAWNDNASNWQSLLSTIRSHRDVSFDVVINPDSGPGGSGPGQGRDDVNYVSGATLLKAEPNVRTLGYVHTDYGRLAADAVVRNVSAWAAWPAAAAPRGIFFDETPNGNPWNPNGYESAYMRGLAERARAVGTVGDFLVFNVGQKVVDANVPTYFDVADQVIVFEESWATYKAVNPVANNLPQSRAADSAAIIVHTFTGDLAALGAELDRIGDADVGGVWFTTTDYHQYTAPPANAENQARLLS
ncbi:hypothetical protein MAPG_05327 [Magnaporthiopsis poae ATCC 64411]|uniref:Spherulin-4 n=1 Tax=Magnaporthiopsis poae (strain ATCC 64411 / 73-15) TaxID=644358 RepID=A0A0C4DZ38_MAGP6|nr:hypothetical protein MAPG_05327 [Magnaporthiopsis poae ATCC 64411]